jgi:putative ABC transport system substrate-binding protein
MLRREFIALLGGAAAWPLAASAQQPVRVSLVGALFLSDNPPYAATLRQELRRLGWVEGRNLQINYRFSGGDIGHASADAAELVNLDPDVIFVIGGPAIQAVQQHTPTIPIVFVGGGDASSTNLTGGIARPAGNTTGFATTINSEGGKWVELLKDAAPRITRVAHVRNFDTLNTEQIVPIVEAAAAKLAITLVRVPYRNSVAGMERAIDEFAAEPNGALLITGVRAASDIYGAVLRQAVQHRLPTMYGTARRVQEGLLMSYGPDLLDLIRGAATEIDRILRGAKPAEFPVQFPTKIPLVINLRTAKAIGLEIPPTMMLRADEVIE